MKFATAKGKILGVMAASVIALSSGMLAGCTGYEPAFKATPMTEKVDRSVAYYAYVGADRLIRQARLGVTVDTPLLVGTIGDVNNVETTTALGRVVSEQVAARFVQRGYQVAELKLRSSVNIQDNRLGGQGAGEFLLSRDVRAIAGEHKAAGIVTGTYAVAEKDVLFNLRIIDVAQGTVLAATDFTIPRTDDVDALLGDGGNKSFFSQPLQY